MGVRRGKEVEGGDFSKKFFPRRVMLTVEGIYGGGGYIGSGGLMLKRKTSSSSSSSSSSSKGPTRALQGFERMTENILYTTMRSPRRRRLRKECRPRGRSRSSYGTRWKPFTGLVTNRSRQSASATRFGGPFCIAYSRWGRTNML